MATRIILKPAKKGSLPAKAFKLAAKKAAAAKPAKPKSK
jgi:hypothetical protein